MIYCSKCGTSLPDEAIVCYKCAAATSVKPQQIEKEKRPIVRASNVVAGLATFILLGLAGVGIIVAIIMFSQNRPPNSPLPIPPAISQLIRTTIFNEFKGVPANSYWVSEFNVDRSAKLTCGFKVQGSGSPTAEVLILPINELENWKQSKEFRTVCRSGYVNRDKCTRNIQPGRYALVFNNYADILNAKTIAAEIYYE